jgi:N6-L-threonylcarbamoyladenine synthase
MSVLLAIETSCDETAAAVVEDGRRVLANVVASQVALHAPSGGVVPELAARAHLRWIVPVVEEARLEAGAAWDRIDAVAVTEGPGLAGCLLVGINFAKALGVARGWPVVPVNHLEGHIHAAWLDADPDAPAPEFPLVALVVSGGHTMLVEMTGALEYEVLGQTVDDAAGEAFDKVARLLGLSYPGGPAIQAAAASWVPSDVGGDPGTDQQVTLPRAWMGDSYDFSFSGLKTAVRRIVEGWDTESTLAIPQADRGARVARLAAAFQEAVVDVLVTKTLRAATERGARSIVLGGGVAANTALRERLAAGAAAQGTPLHVPAPEYCTDNAAMIGAAGFARFVAGERAGLDLDARPSLPLAV